MKILLVQTSFLGDTILSSPVIKGIKHLYPDCELWMMTTPEAESLVTRDPMLSGVISYAKRGKDSGIIGLYRIRKQIESMEFDIVYSLHRSARTSYLLWLCSIPKRIGYKCATLSFLYTDLNKRVINKHAVYRSMSILQNELPLVSMVTDLRLFPPDKKHISPNVLKKTPLPNSYIVLAPGSVWKTKMWHWTGYRKVAEFFINEGFDIVLIGAPSDQKISSKVSENINTVDLTGRCSISEAMYIVKYARLLICNDSMPLHMASALKTPNIAIFCATSPEFGFSPWKNRARIVEKKIPCKPCSRHGEKKCPNGTWKCIKDLTHTEVINSAKKLLKM